jgi:uncharacterized protein (DUF2384 family)
MNLDMFELPRRPGELVTPRQERFRARGIAKRTPSRRRKVSLELTREVEH